MGKINWKWTVSLLWESLPSSLQDTIRKWGWDTLLGLIVMVAFFIWKAVRSISNQPPEIVALLGLGFFTVTLYLTHFLRTWVGFRREAKRDTGLNIYERNTYNWDY